MQRGGPLLSAEAPKIRPSGWPDDWWNKLFLLYYVRELNFDLRIAFGLLEHSRNLALRCILHRYDFPDTSSTSPKSAVVLSILGISPPDITINQST